MLQDIRANVGGPFTKIVVVLIILAFALFGIDNILLGGSSNAVAVINDEEVGPEEYRMALNTYQRRLLSMMGDDVDPALLDADRLRPQVIDSIVQRELQVQVAAELGMAVSEEEVGRVVSTMEQFQLNGAFDPDLYKNLLAELGYTPAYFKQILIEDILLTQLQTGLAGSEFSTSAERALGARIGAEQRDIRYLTIPVTAFSEQGAPSESAIEAYYDSHQNDFLSPESVELAYIELRVEDFFQPVEEDTLLDAYEVAKSNLAYSTENRVSHILFSPREDESEEERIQRLEQAQAELASGVDFAEVAGKYSDDFGSVDAGGDLGFSAGEAFPETMEAAIAALDLNVVSDVVETDAGLHLIMVTERREGNPPTLAELRPQLETQIQQQAAKGDLLRVVDDLSNLTFNSEDLAGPAQELELTVSRSEAVTRDQQEGLFATPALLSAAFSDDVLEGGLNSDVIELDPGHFVALRVLRHNEAQVEPLEVVAGRISQILLEEAARIAVEQAAREAVAVLRAGERVENYANSNGYEWQVELGASRRNTNVPAAVLRRAFQLSAPEGDSTLVDYVINLQGDALVLELDGVTTGEYGALAKQERDLLVRQLISEYAGMVDSEYRAGLRSAADVTVM